jgi:phospholipid-binding lipoprotein MlaA
MPVERAGAIALLACVLGACATTPEGSRVDYDPWEPINRSIYTVNDVADRYLLKPVAKGYDAVLPDFAQTGVTNFSRNLLAPGSAINNFLQGKPRDGFSEITRFLFNSTIGIGGLIDVATMGGLEEKHEDFGQTFAVWGVPDGPYVMVPFLGPRTLTHAASIPLNVWSDPLWHYEVTSVRNKLEILRLINLRANLLDLDRFLEDSKDPYITLRESYLQNREFEIYDGDPPMDDDFYDEFEEDFEGDYEDDIDENADGAVE